MIRMEELVSGIRTVGISGHIRPDGDAIGSCMGLYLYFRERHPEIDAYVFLEEIPPEYRFISHIGDIRHDFVSPVESFDLFFALDCGKERLGGAETIFDKAKKTVNIDHHVTNPGTGDVNHVVADASSTSELVAELIGTENLTKESATALYMGMVTDTGVFKYSNTSTKTMRIAGELLTYDFDFSALIDHVFFEKTYRQNLILGKALLESYRILDDKCIVSCISKRVMEFYQVVPSDLDGIVSQLNLTKDVECAMFLYEQKPLQYKVSLRSKGNVDVAKIAALFGGGGHARAAGCSMEGTHFDVINNLTSYIAEELQTCTTD